MSMTFADAVALRRTSATTFTGDVPAGWDIAGATNGGYLTALVASAVIEVLGADDPVTVTTHFFTPVRPGPVVVEVDELRRQGKDEEDVGRSYAHDLSRPWRDAF